MSFDHTESAYSPQNVFRGASIRGANFGRCRLTISLSSTRISFAAQLAVVGPITASSVGGIARPRFVVNSRRKGKSCYCLHSMLGLVLRSAITGSERPTAAAAAAGPATVARGIVRGPAGMLCRRPGVSRPESEVAPITNPWHRKVCERVENSLELFVCDHITVRLTCCWVFYVYMCFRPTYGVHF